MTFRTRKQASTKAGDSDPPEESRELPPTSTRPSRTKKSTARKPRPKPMEVFRAHNLLLDLPPELRDMVYEYCVAADGPVKMMETGTSKKSRTPSLLSVNRQIREEALPVYYKTNEFRFGRCHAKYITRWLFRAVQPQHLKLISAISWTSKSQIISSSWIGSTRRWSDSMKVYTKAAQESAIHLSSVIMLLELGFLGPCKVKMFLCNEPRLHVACTLRQLTRNMIVRKKLTQVDAWNEDDVPGEDDVAGLAYAVAQDWARSAPQAFQDGRRAPPLAPEVYCSSCQSVSTSCEVRGKGMISRLPWVSRNGGTDTIPNQPEKTSSTQANE